MIAPAESSREKEIGVTRGARMAATRLAIDISAEVGRYLVPDMPLAVEVIYLRRIDEARWYSNSSG
jgi:hypothetical protein